MTNDTYPNKDKDLAEHNDFDYSKMDEGLSYTELLQKYREEIYYFQFTRKKAIILRLALQLEKEGMSKETISAKITEDLQSYDISDRYIREILGPDYKQESKKRQKICGKSSANNSTEIEEPVKISITTNGHPTNYDEEIKQIYHDPERNGNNNTHDIQPNDTVLRWMDLARDKDLEIGQLKEQLKEQKQQIQDLITSVNAVAEAKKERDKKPNPVTETLEYKTLKTENSILEQRIIELEQIVKESMKTNPTIGFQSATNMQRDSNEKASDWQVKSNEITTITTTIPNKIEFPAELFSKFFIATRNVKKSLFLKINEDTKVEGWVE